MVMLCVDPYPVNISVFGHHRQQEAFQQNSYPSYQPHQSTLERAVSIDCP